MVTVIPGTVIPSTAASQGNAFSALAPTLNATGGLTLSQVCDLTGLPSTTIQNWIKRGWVANPHGKRYGEAQLARILIINLLRGSLQLVHIVALMRYINGSVEDRSDDILPDRDLYDLLCSMICQLDAEAAPSADPRYLQQTVDRLLATHPLPDAASQEKLRHALQVMLLAYLASALRAQAEQTLYEYHIMEEITS